MSELRIGVFGSAAYDEGNNLVRAATLIGETIAKSGHIVVTGACEGLPQEAVKGAKKYNGKSVGFSAVTTKEDHEKIMKTSIENYDTIEYIPEEYKYKDNVLVCRKYRNVASVASCDIALFISGRWGTLNEFSLAIDMGKFIGVFNAEGKFSSKVKELLDYFKKPSQSKLIYEKEATELVTRIIKEYKAHHDPIRI
jgi:predicted Rossmann-fold nucleotide-binding protein